jgi:hypothetical protein
MFIDTHGKPCSSTDELIKLTKSDKSAYIGVFWFKEDYSDFDYQAPAEEISGSDITHGWDFVPQKGHRGHKQNIFYNPRGRVELFRGVFRITVGDSCPDSAIDLVKREYGLIGYQVEVRRNAYWDKK